jgi:Domain of unknown function (DUF4249)
MKKIKTAANTEKHRLSIQVGSIKQFYFRAMNKKKYSIGIASTLIIAAAACLEPYQPPATDEVVNILVVDGFLNSTDGSATVSLGHTISLSSQDKPEPEFDAAVSILVEGGGSYALTQQDSGIYAISGLIIDPNAKYRLSVRTPDGEDYLSDDVEIIPSPAIDSITWDAKENGVNIMVNAHDAAGNTRYYRWDYVETWRYHAPLSSDYKVVNGVPVYRTDDERIYTCWRTIPSTKITITSTVRLADDIVYQYPVTFLPMGSSKISVKYSILIKQRGVSKNEYDFLQQLQKTTESIGGLFDPQPSQVTGNIRNLNNPLVPVLGYFSAGEVKEERLFIDFYDLPDYLQKTTRPLGCFTQDSVFLPHEWGGSETIVSAIYEGRGIIGYTQTSPICADCRLQGGSLITPAFWP